MKRLALLLAFAYSQEATGILIINGHVWWSVVVCLIGWGFTYPLDLRDRNGGWARATLIGDHDGLLRDGRLIHDPACHCEKR